MAHTSHNAKRALLIFNPPPKVHTSIGVSLGHVVRVANEERQKITPQLAKANSLSKELGYRMSGNVTAAEQVKGERIAEERAKIATESARSATKFHDVATKYIETPASRQQTIVVKPTDVYVKGTTTEIDLSKKPFSDAITSKVKQEIKNHEAKKANPDKKTNENLTTPSETSGSLLCVHLKKVS